MGKLRITQFPAPPSFMDAVKRARFVRATESEEMTVMQAYDLAVAELNVIRPTGHPAGFRVSECGQLKRIPNSIPFGQGVPREQPEPVIRPLSIATIDAVDDEEQEPEIVALPSPLADAEETAAADQAELAREAREALEPSGEVGDVEDDKFNCTDKVTLDGEDGQSE